MGNNKKRKKEKKAYYAIYQDIINLAEKWPPPDISEKWASMIERLGVKPKITSIIHGR